MGNQRQVKKGEGLFLIPNLIGWTTCYGDFAT